MKKNSTRCIPLSHVSRKLEYNWLADNGRAIKFITRKGRALKGALHDFTCT